MCNQPLILNCLYWLWIVDLKTKYEDILTLAWLRPVIIRPWAVCLCVEGAGQACTESEGGGCRGDGYWEDHQLSHWPAHHLAVLLHGGWVCLPFSYLSHTDLPTTWQSYLMVDGYACPSHISLILTCPPPRSPTSWQMGMPALLAYLSLTDLPTTSQSYFMADGYACPSHISL